ncbi:MAG: hypothetical protein PHD97_07785 [Bacteroidales bacterium]|nr:hypothetical protein [Bacteroidales bacterium]
MKKLSVLSLLCIALLFSCKKKSSDNDTSPSPGSGSIVLTGAQSPMGNVGTAVTTSTGTIAGVSSFTASVTALTGGVSTYTGSAIITNTTIKNLLSNVPEITISGDTVSTTTMKFKSTVEGIECCSGPGKGILVKYSSNVANKYPITSTSKYRTVAVKDTTDSYYWGGMYIKYMRVDEDPTYLASYTGITKLAYYANHHWGLVTFEITFSDLTVATFPVYNSTSNP